MGGFGQDRADSLISYDEGVTFAPESLLQVRRVFKVRWPYIEDADFGIVGGPSHVLTGTSYHLGRDELKFTRDPYSVRTARDKAGLSDAASAFDITDNIGTQLLRELNVWLVAQCRAKAPDTLDIREIIYSPDGVVVLTWDREKGVTSFPLQRGSSSHRTHTHISWYRDSEFKDRAAVFKRFFASRQPTAQGAIDMFLLKVRNEETVWISDGMNTRHMPGGHWELTCVPLIRSGVPLLEYDTSEQVFAAGGPLAKSSEPSEPVSEELLERVLRRIMRSVPQ